MPGSTDNLTLPAAGESVATRSTSGNTHVQRFQLEGGSGTSLVPVLARTVVPQQGDASIPVRQAPVDFWRCGFAQVGSGLVTTDLVLEQTGPGMAISQSGGNLVITTGTTANSETVIRSNRVFRDALQMRFKVILSQRIANQTFRIELADLIGSGLSYVINSATSVTVTFPTGQNPWNSGNVGQSCRLSEITGAAGIPGRYAIASVSGDTVTFTVAGWPASGSGTLQLYGMNYITSEYSGAVSLQCNADAQRRGWNSGNTSLTINATSSPGHVMQVTTDVLNANWSDGVVATSTGQQWTSRGNRIENVPDADTDMYVFLVIQNGSTAPASTTTLTMGFIQVEQQGRNKVRLAHPDQPTTNLGIPVQVLGTATTSISNTPAVTINAGTNAIGDVGTSYRTTVTGAALTHHIVSAGSGDAVNVKSSQGRLMGWHLANTAASWRYVKLHNIATAPTLGAGVVFTIPIPPGGVATFMSEGGRHFASGIGRTITTGASDADTTPAAANDVIGELFFA